jgi:hypothetical protein
MLKNPSSTEFQKAISMKKLAFVGDEESVEPMSQYLDDPHLSSYARMGLEGNPSPRVNEVLREALPNVSGRHKIGVITSLGYRKDTAALPALTALLGDSDAGIGGAAAAAIAEIGGLDAARALQDALGNPRAPAFPVVARATLVCADRLLPTNRDRALELYNALTTNAMPRPVQLNALRKLNLEATAPEGSKRWVPPTGAAAEADQSGFLGRGR